jgi:predicted alpha/beta-fold hydrolase
MFSKPATNGQQLFGLKFKPHLLARNTHFQTTYSSMRPYPTTINAKAQPMTLNLAHNTRLLGYYTPAPRPPARGLVLMLHGWLGSSNGQYILAVTDLLHHLNYATFRLNFRDHGDTHPLNSGVFRSDRIDEVVDAARVVAQLEPECPLHIFGVSLGGNFALRVAWRHSLEPFPNLGQTIAICPVLDPYRSTVVMDKTPMYLWYFRRRWRNAFHKKQRQFPERYDFSREIAAPTCMEMTEQFMRCNGPYPDAMTYFQTYTITTTMMARLASPVVMLTAADDPVIPVSDFYRFEGLSPWLTVNIQRYGGHVGFIDLFPLRYWITDAVATILHNWEETYG